MKRLFLLLMAVVAMIMPVFAELTGDGYYRIHNYNTNRYIYVYDNHGSLDYTATRVDLYAIQLWTGIDRAISDPASVVYIEKHGNQYDFKTQGTSVYSMISSYVNVRADSKVPGTYWAYGSKGGLTKYLCDGSDDPSEAQSWLIGEGTSQRNWYITPISATSDNYFGVSPTIKASGKSYAPLYADFPFSFASKNMKAYYVKSFDAKRGLAVWTEITGAVDRAVPVIIECASDDKSNNRLNLGASSPVKPSDSKLTGVYFNYDEAYGHINQVANDKKTMRVLGVTADGSIGLVTSNAKHIDRNSFYMKVPSTAPAEFKLVTQKEYDDIVANEPPEVESVSLDKTSVEMYVNETLQLTAKILPEKAAVQPVTWKSSDTKVATVDNDGVVTSKTFGTATITATCGGKSATCKVIVAPKVATVLTLDPTSLKVPEGYTAQINATLVIDDAYDKTVVWKSANTAVATVDAKGLVKGIAIGETTISATCGGVTAICKVTVTEVVATEVILSESEVEIIIGGNTVLTATVLPDNAVNKTVVWSSADPTIAEVNNRGRVTAVSVGTVEIYGTCGDVKGVCVVTVKPILATSLILSASSLKMNKGDSKTLTANVLPRNVTFPTVTWTSSDESVATVSADGVVTAIRGGEAVITASCPDAKAECKVTVASVMASEVTLNKSKVEVMIGGTVELSATVKPDDADNKTVVWSSADTSIAEVDSNGRVTAVGVGTVEIYATCGNVKSVCVVTVKPIVATSLVLSETSLKLTKGETMTLAATVQPANVTYPAVTWTSSDETVATVNTDGVVTAVSKGEAVITASCPDAKAECKVTVSNSEDGIIDIEIDGVNQFDIYGVNGVKIKSNATDLNGLPAGVYIINGIKVLVD